MTPVILVPSDVGGDSYDTYMRAALYLRVSTDRQTIQNQIADLRQLAVTRGYEPALYEEVESAAKARPVLDRMLADARAGRVRASGLSTTFTVYTFGPSRR